MMNEGEDGDDGGEAAEGAEDEGHGGAEHVCVPVSVEYAQANKRN
jgi:hypothetical protein